MATIYVIRMNPIYIDSGSYNFTTLFTTDETKIPNLIKQIEKKHKNTTGRWNYITLYEEEYFMANITHHD